MRLGVFRRCFSRTQRLTQYKNDESQYPIWPDVFAYADGASRGNPGRSGCGALLVDPMTGNVLATDAKYVGDYETNNAAEYHGLVLALQMAQRHQVTHVHIRMDSQLIVRQMQGQYQVKAANLRRLYQQCKDLSAKLPHVTFTHVNREKNVKADQLANEVIDAHAASIEGDLIDH
ncbi:ribonuclease h [Plasmopara halstedii]|uniref:Ribonuclease h n=1 Tax=Plasmopara halstedii TaxID=4781 RepID=A0A0N7L817_PLAHL|nr:ribonuclease h [Plasmopara halstedii]CEG48627.1 ribonuclease h [Plasmopara halstedii]|eukprot:XP_024584996.1 ribonuclease h [Plasmopara halstedii]